MVDYSKIPEHMRYRIKLYIEKGIDPGDFATSILTNNFINAVSRADHINIEHLKDWAEFLYWEIPAEAWGSKEKVAKWVKKGGMNGNKE